MSRKFQPSRRQLRLNHEGRHQVRRIALGMDQLEQRVLLAADGIISGQSDSNGELPPNVSGYVSGEVVVSFRPGVSSDEIKGIYQANNAAELDHLYGMDRVRRISVPEAAADQVIQALSKNPFVEYAERNFVAQRTAVPNDSFYSYQWNLSNSQFGGINIESAWDVTTGAGAVIAVLDTGVAYENYSDATGTYQAAPDLTSTIFVGGYDFINNDAHANDDEGHGTHVAGTIAQSTNNNLGVAGVAYDSSIMPVKVLGADGSGTYTAIANGIRWAADNGAHIINMSLGGGGPSATLENALAYAYSKGVTIIAAAGNDGVNGVSYPAAYDDYVIAVSATRYDEQIASYSNYGSSIDIAAPGGDVTVDQNGDGYGDGILQNTLDPTTNEFAYYFFQGTSMAAPHVAGVAGLVVSLGVTDPDEVRSILLSTAEDKGVAGVDSLYGYGIVDAAAAVAAAASNNQNPIALDDAVTVDEDSAISIDVLFNDSDNDGDLIAVTSVTQPQNGTASINPDGTVLFTPTQDYFGETNFAYEISDGNGGTDTGSVLVTVTSVNDNPIAVDDAADTQQDQSVLVAVLQNDSDVDGDTLSVLSVSAPISGQAVIDQSGAVLYTPNAGFVGEDSFNYVVNDGFGGQSSATVSIAVMKENTAPVASDDSGSVREDESLVIDVLANDTDADSDALVIASTTNPANGTVVINQDGTLTYSPNSNFFGIDAFNYTASDGKGGAATASVSVTVTPWGDLIALPVEGDQSEGNDGATTYSFVIQMDHTLDASVSVSWSIESNETNQDDFIGGIPSGVAVIPAGETEATVLFDVSGDLEPEPDESFYFTLDSVTGTASINEGSALGIIRNDDQLPEFRYVDFAIADAGVFGTADGGIDLTYEADDRYQSISEELYQKNRRSRLEHQWQFNVTGGDAGVTFEMVAGHDSQSETFDFEYNLNDGLGWQSMLSLDSSEAQMYSVEMPIGISGDVFVRAFDTNRSRNESSVDTLYVDLMQFVSTRSTPLPPRVSIQVVDGNASEVGSEPGRVQFSIDQVQSTDLVVSYSVSGTADDSDYQETLSGQVVIPAGQTAVEVQVTPVDDDLPEGGETVVLNLTTDSNYDIMGASSGTIFINDDDLNIANYFATAEYSISGLITSGNLQSTVQIDGTSEVLSEISTNGKPSRRVSYLEHHWSFQVDQAQSFHLTADRPNNTDNDNFVFEYSVNDGTDWIQLVTVATPNSTTYAVSLPESISGELLLRVVDSDPDTPGRGSRDEVRVDQMYFSTEAVSGVQQHTTSSVKTLVGFEGALKIDGSRPDGLVIESESGFDIPIKSGRFHAVVRRDQSFDARGARWKVERVEIQSGKVVQIATDGKNTMVVEGSGWRNFVSPSDVNNDESISALDALVILNELGRRRFSNPEAGALDNVTRLLSEGSPFFDQNGDGACTALDALRIINELTQQGNDAEAERIIPEVNAPLELNEVHEGQRDHNGTENFGLEEAISDLAFYKNHDQQALGTLDQWFSEADGEDYFNGELDLGLEVTTGEGLESWMSKLSVH